MKSPYEELASSRDRRRLAILRSSGLIGVLLILLAASTADRPAGFEEGATEAAHPRVEGGSPTLQPAPVPNEGVGSGLQ